MFILRTRNPQAEFRKPFRSFINDIIPYRQRHMGEARVSAVRESRITGFPKAKSRNKEVSVMLSMQMKSGEYLTIGDNVVVQLFKESGPQFRISIKAPREVPIVRGKVLERKGEERPEGLLDRKPKKSPSSQAHSERSRERLARREEARAREQKLRDDTLKLLDEIIDGMEPSPERDKLDEHRLQLEYIADLLDMAGKESVRIGKNAKEKE